MFASEQGRTPEKGEKVHGERSFTLITDSKVLQYKKHILKKGKAGESGKPWR